MNFLVESKNFLLLFFALYGSTTIQSRLFLKNIKNFVWLPKQYLLGFFILEKFWTGVSCFSVTLFYSILLALTHRQHDRQRLKYTRYAWAGGTFFPVVLLCQFSVLVGNRFLVLHTPYVLTVPYSCGVVLVFLIWWEIVFGMYILSVQYSCAVVSVFLMWWES